MATIWFVLSGVCILAGAILLWRSGRRRPTPEPAPPPDPQEEPFDLFKKP